MGLTNEKSFIAGNWKMFKTIPEAVELVEALKAKSDEFEGAEVVVIPPYPALHAVSEALGSSSIQTGAQNLFWETQGAFTGEVSGPMLKAAGCRYVVIGHSERRRYFGENDSTVNKKIKAALEHGLVPIMCIGETKEEREKDKTIQKVETQILRGLDGVGTDEFSGIILAYEPIWAIGTGLTATPEQAQEVHAFIRNKLSDIYGQETATYAIILYGGSVKPGNTFSLLKEKDINGALVGGASLEAGSFSEIVKESIKAYREK